MCAAPIQPRTNRGHASQSRPGAGSPQSSQRTARTNVRAPEKIRLADENGFATTRVVRTAREFRGPLRFRRASRASDANGYPPSPASLKPSRRFWPKRGQKLQFDSPNPPICPLFGQIGRFAFLCFEPPWHGSHLPRSSVERIRPFGKNQRFLGHPSGQRCRPTPLRAAAPSRDLPAWVEALEEGSLNRQAAVFLVKG